MRHIPPVFRPRPLDRSETEAREPAPQRAQKAAVNAIVRLGMTAEWLGTQVAGLWGREPRDDE